MSMIEKMAANTPNTSVPIEGQGEGLPVSRLTPSQRLHFDVYGYVVLEDVLTPDETAAMKDALYRLKAEPDLATLRVYVNIRNDYTFHVGHILEYDPALLAYAVHPRLIPLVEEVVGGSVRVEETEAVINRRDSRRDDAAWGHRHSLPLGFHTGTRHGWGTYLERHRFHCLFVKTIVFLTDVGPDDGGTAVIPGSHRLSWPQQEIIDAALAGDSSLIHQVQAKAGSVLLFPESLVHSTTAIRSEKERVILITGYTPPMMREWPGNEISATFAESLPDHIKTIVTGGESWKWRRLNE
jgi:hypothetical protein